VNDWHVISRRSAIRCAIVVGPVVVAPGSEFREPDTACSKDKQPDQPEPNEHGSGYLDSVTVISLGHQSFSPEQQRASCVILSMIGLQRRSASAGPKNNVPMSMQR
jgi:hypothetical protein